MIRRALGVLCVLVPACGGDSPSGDPAGASYHVGGSVTGLTGTLVLRNNGEELTVGGNGRFVFANRLATGGSYRVAVARRPAGQVCAVEGGDGTIGRADVDDILVECTVETHLVAVTVTGLTGAMQLTNNVDDELAVHRDGVHYFAVPVALGSTYAVVVDQQPATRHCTVTGGTGTMGTADVRSVVVACVPTYALGGSVDGLTGTLVLRSGGDEIQLTQAGSFAFPTRLVDGTPYEVTVAGQPATQRCRITAGGEGTVAAADVDTVGVTCLDAHHVRGSLAGLLAGTLVLVGEDGLLLPVGADGDFELDDLVAEGDPWSVAIATQPTGQHCDVEGAGGVMGDEDVDSVVVTCRKLAVTIDEVHARPASAAFGDANGDGVRDGAHDEFVELLNRESFPVALGGWVLVTGGASQLVRLTFAPGTTLAPGARLLVFGGGTPTGAFGGAQTFTAALNLTDSPAAGASFTVAVQSLAAGGVRTDAYAYDNSAFGGSCSTTCMSRTRDADEAFVAHGTLAGSPGIRWSPGVAAAAAIPKVSSLLTFPAPGSLTASVAPPLRVQFNMSMTTADLDETTLRLHPQPCDTLGEALEVPVAPGLDDAHVLLTPVTLTYATQYCLVVDASVRSAAATPLAGEVRLGFTTRPAASVAAGDLVLAEVGGCRMSSTSSTACGGGAATNDEFVELYNPTQVAIDASGMQLSRRTTSGGASCVTTLPDPTSIPAGGYYLIAGAGYDPTRYPGAPVADVTVAGSLFTGDGESLLLLDGSGSCTGTTGILDAVSLGPVSDTFTGLPLPALGTLADGTSIERKACFDSIAGADATGMRGGHAARGNGERLGSSTADWVVGEPGPQSSASAVEPRDCAQ